MGKKIYTEEQDAFLKRHPILDRVILTSLFNREFGTAKNVEQIRNHCRCQLGLKMVNVTRFNRTSKTGHKFKKGEYPKGCEKSWFKKGHSIHEEGVGYEYKRADTGHLLIKVTSHHKESHKNFMLKHRYILEQAHGKLKKNECIVFKDGDKTNCTLENMMVVNRSEFGTLVKKDFFKEQHPQIREAVVLVTKLERIK